MKLKTLLAALYSLAFLAAATMPLYAQAEDDSMYGGRPEHHEKAQALHKEHLKKYKDKSDVLVLPGLVAKRTEKQVELLCETTTLSAMNSAEYMIVASDSSHGYEAMFWSFAKPSDVHKALEFIGAKAGTPRNDRMLQLWSNGDRVVASVLFDGAPVRLEELIFDTEKKETLPHEGFIFTGSVNIDNQTGGTERVYLADAYDPKSIIPSYNEPASVLDPPWQASKGEFYESHVVNPELPLKSHNLMTILLEPEFKDGRTRAMNLNLSINSKMEFLLTDSQNGKQINTETTFEAAIKACSEAVSQGKEPYVTMHFDNSLSLEAIRKTSAVMILLDTQSGLKIGPPPEGHPYYRAFVPNPDWRDAEDRIDQPWELHLAVTNDKLAGTMVFHDASWKDGQSKPDLTKSSYEVKTAEDVSKLLKKDTEERKAAGKRIPPTVLFIYAPADLTYGKLLGFIAPAMKTHNTVHVFLNEEK